MSCFITMRFGSGFTVTFASRTVALKLFITSMTCELNIHSNSRTCLHAYIHDWSNLWSKEFKMYWSWMLLLRPLQSWLLFSITEYRFKMTRIKFPVLHLLLAVAITLNHRSLQFPQGFLKWFPLHFMIFPFEWFQFEVSIIICLNYSSAFYIYSLFSSIWHKLLIPEFLPSTTRGILSTTGSTCTTVWEPWLFDLLTPLPFCWINYDVMVSLDFLYIWGWDLNHIWTHFVMSIHKTLELKEDGLSPHEWLDVVKIFVRVFVPDLLPLPPPPPLIR